MKTYLFYDIETSGLNKCFDQVLQFAAIRTDQELNEIERQQFVVKLNPDTILHPRALLTHKISLAKLANDGISEYEAALRIHASFNTPETITIGYNSLGFDDEFLRFVFYRNLLPPYKHQYADGCGRADLYPMAVLYRLFKTELLNWPKIEGVVSLKLDNLNMANNFCLNGSAHDAMIDTEICLALARIFHKDRNGWDYALDYFSKDADLRRIQSLPCALSVDGTNFTNGLLIDGVFGAERFYQAPVLNLGQHYHYKNQTIFLRLDEANLPATNLNNISEMTKVYRKKFGETGFLLPLRDRFIRYLSKERLEISVANQNWLANNPSILQAIRQYYLDYKYPVVPNVDIDAALYQNGFLTNQELSACQRFHAVDLTGKINWLESCLSPNLRLQAVRILGRNYVEYLPTNLKNEFNAYLQAVWQGSLDFVDYRGEKRLKVTNVLSEIASLSQNRDLSEKDKQLLIELENYFNVQEFQKDGRIF